MAQTAISAPPKTLQTLDGLIMARVCEGDACVLSQVEVHLRVDDDGTGYIAYWDPTDPMRNETVHCHELCEVEAVKRMLAAISSLAPEQS